MPRPPTEPPDPRYLPSPFEVGMYMPGVKGKAPRASTVPASPGEVRGYSGILTAWGKRTTRFPACCTTPG